MRRSMLADGVSLVPGRVHYVDGESVWLSRGSSIYKSDDSGDTWQMVARLPQSRPERLLASSRLSRRLFRSGVHHILPLTKSSWVVMAGRAIFAMDPVGGGASKAGQLTGSRPLVPCASAGTVFYGEYRGNRERSPVSVWASEDGASWLPVWEFRGVRHIHSVLRDPYTGWFWVTTGDDDHEAAIWITRDQFQSMEKLLGGEQRFRAVQLVFRRDAVFFGSDALTARNHIYRLDRKTGRVEALQEVSGTVFYGCTVGDRMFVGTTVEPSTAEEHRFAEVWESTDGERWSRRFTFRKDVWPMKLFQYGQVTFPSGPGDGEHLWLTPIATEFDEHALRINIRPGATGEGRLRGQA